MSKYGGYSKLYGFSGAIAGNSRYSRNVQNLLQETAGTAHYMGGPGTSRKSRYLSNIQQTTSLFTVITDKSNNWDAQE